MRLYYIVLMHFLITVWKCME